MWVEKGFVQCKFGSLSSCLNVVKYMEVQALKNLMMKKERPDILRSLVYNSNKQHHHTDTNLCHWQIRNWCHLLDSKLPRKVMKAGWFIHYITLLFNRFFLKRERDWFTPQIAVWILPVSTLMPDQLKTRQQWVYWIAGCVLKKVFWDKCNTYGHLSAREKEERVYGSIYLYAFPTTTKCFWNNGYFEVNSVENYVHTLP